MLSLSLYKLSTNLGFDVQAGSDTDVGKLYFEVLIGMRSISSLFVPVSTTELPPSVVPEAGVALVRLTVGV